MIKYELGEIVEVEGFNGLAKIIEIEGDRYRIQMIDHKLKTPFFIHISEIWPNDNRKDTLIHINEVKKFVNKTIDNLTQRAKVHDESKLVSPEREIFEEYTPKLKETKYGSDEYRQYLKEMNIGLQHHYENNSHHPEHHKDGITDMSLLDLIEMICDWKAAVLRHADGDIYKSIEMNQKRFGYSDELKQIFINTIKELE